LLSASEPTSDAIAAVAAVSWAVVSTAGLMA
jgi:hypothetical protein